MAGDEVLSEPEVVALLGAERFRRLRAGNWLAPFFEVPGHEGRPVYIKHLVDFRHQEDLRLHPPGRGPAVVRKAPARRGGVPEVVTDRNSVRTVVVKASAPAAARLVSPQVEAEFGRLLAAARRFLAARGVPC
jgi:hypothetical protein